MGAQTEQRLKQFTKRFEEWDDPHNETPPYHYGTHYSSAMIVSSYLVRLEPFTQHFLRLQGGRGFCMFRIWCPSWNYLVQIEGYLLVTYHSCPTFFVEVACKLLLNCP